jgi:enolase
MIISYELGEFKENSYDEWQLIDYDLLIRCDIKSFYDNIYTHYISYDVTNDLYIDKPLSHMNHGRTGGIIMGNYISLFVAELLSKKISDRFENRIVEFGLDCNFSYFSDDFYIFTSKDNKDKVIKLFAEVLEEFGLEKNEDKLEMLDYLKYTNEDVIEKY